jgi:Ca2+-binding EF-hand superfamily protein
MSEEDFAAIDTDGDGYISASELLRSFADKPEISYEDMVTVVTMADENGDNRISYEEYAKLVP